MSILVGQQMDFQGLQALNLVFHSSAAASPPASPVEGMPWYVTDADVLKVYTGSVWNSLVVGPASSTSGRVPVWNGTSGGALNDGYDVVTSVGDPGVDTAIPTDQAVREAIAAAIASEVTWKGGYDANTNTPDLDVSPSGVKKGDMYYVTAAGTFFTTPLEAGDVIIANIDSADAESEWTMVQKNLPAMIPVANGGTGAGTFTAYSLIASGTTATGAFTQIAETTQYKVLFSGTVSAYPSWSPYTIPATVAAYTMFYASSTSAISTITAAGTTGTFIRGTSGAAPAWSTLVLPNAAAIGDLLQATSSNTLAVLSSVSAGSYLRSVGVTTASVWSTLKLANSLVQWGMLYAATADNLTSAITAATVTGSFLRGTSGAAPAWGALAYPDSAAVGDIPYASTTAAITMLTSVATAGSFLRGGGTTTAPAWSAVKLPDTMSAFGVWVANTVNTVVNLTVTALQSIRLNSAGTAWEAYTPTGGGNHNILDGSTHPDSVAQTVTRGSLIYGNATPKWDELTLASGGQGYILVNDGTDAKWGKFRYCVKLSTSATSYDVVHNLGTRRVLVSCQDTNCQDIKIEWRCKSGAEATTVTVSFGTAPSANTRIITVYGMNFGEALDTAN